MTETDAEPEPKPSPHLRRPHGRLMEQFAQRVVDPSAEPLFVSERRLPPRLPEPISLPEGMEMVETRTDRAKTVARSMSRSLSEPRRARPRPEAPVVIPDEPLQQVETRK